MNCKEQNNTRTKEQKNSEAEKKKRNGMQMIRKITEKQKYMNIKLS